MKITKEKLEELEKNKDEAREALEAWNEIKRLEKVVKTKDAEIERLAKSRDFSRKACEELLAQSKTKDALIKELAKANVPSRVMELLVKPLENENKALKDKIKELEKEVLRIRWKNENN